MANPLAVITGLANAKSPSNKVNAGERRGIRRSLDPRYSRGSFTDQPSKHHLATFRKMKFKASIVTINASTTEPSTALRR
jgi:hypothetical protein